MTITTLELEASRVCVHTRRSSGPVGITLALSGSSAGKGVKGKCQQNRYTIIILHSAPSLYALFPLSQTCVIRHVGRYKGVVSELRS